MKPIVLSYRARKSPNDWHVAGVEISLPSRSRSSAVLFQASVNFTSVVTIKKIFSLSFQRFLSSLCLRRLKSRGELIILSWTMPAKVFSILRACDMHQCPNDRSTVTEQEEMIYCNDIPHE